MISPMLLRRCFDSISTMVIVSPSEILFGSSPNMVLTSVFNRTNDYTDQDMMPFGMIYKRPRDRRLKVDAHQGQSRSGRCWCKGLRSFLIFDLRFLICGKM